MRTPRAERRRAFSYRFAGWLLLAFLIGLLAANLIRLT